MKIVYKIFDASYKPLMHYQENFILKDKIKANVQFVNAFNVNEKNIKLKGGHSNGATLLRKVKWNAKYKNLDRIGITYNVKDKLSTE